MTTLHGEPVEIGNRVWCIRMGWGKVTGIDNDPPFPLTVEFDLGLIENYTESGLFMLEDRCSTLFWDEIRIESPKKPKQSMAMTHELKIWPQFFRQVADGKKLHEIRNNDRNFQEGDRVVLMEWNPDTEKYSGRRINAVIGAVTTRIDHPVLLQGLCVFTLLDVSVPYFEFFYNPHP